MHISTSESYLRLMFVLDLRFIPNEMAGEHGGKNAAISAYRFRLCHLPINTWEGGH